MAAFASVGSYAEYAVASEQLCWPLPDGVDWESAAAFPTIGITAYNLLTSAGRLVPGESVLIHAAAGGVGTVAIQLAKRLGAAKVIGTVGDDAKADLVKNLGCDDVINYRQDDFASRVNETTGGAGVDLILDSVAGRTFDQGLTCLAPFGRVCIFGIIGGEPGRVASDQLHPVNRAVIGYSTGHLRRNRPGTLRSAGEAIIDLLQKGELKLVIGARYPLNEAQEAHRLVESRQSTGKVILTI